MNIITLDYETFWSADYSLSKMSPLEYVMGDQFEAISCAVKVGDEPTEVHLGEAAITRAFDRLDIAGSGLLAHNNSGFDAYVSAYRFGLKPRMWLCTAAMARPIHAKTIGVSLKRLVEHYGVGVKNDAILMATRGKRLEDFTPEELRLMATYNAADTDQCWALFQKLKPHYNAAELWQIDALTRMRTEPAFELDDELLEKALVEERTAKHTALMELASMLPIEDEGDSDEVIAEKIRAVLASAPMFAKLLDSCGVEVPMKPSPTNPERQVPALAKTDEAFIALQDHGDPVVSTAARARLAVKSTLLETRIVKLRTAAGLAGGRLPIPIRYCGADTTGRDSGEEYNPQNLPRIAKGHPKRSDALRNSLRVPAGKKIIVADQSGIELRVNHFLWKVPSSMALYEDDAQADLYRAFAAARYGIDPEAVDKVQRQLAKVAQLGLGFGAGPATFLQVARTMGGIQMELAEAENVVAAWRQSYPEICQGWRDCHAALDYIAAGDRTEIDPWGLTHTSAEGIHLPSGRVIRYPGLRQEAGEARRREWWYGEGRHKARIYAGKITENIVQALARDSIFDCAVQYYRLTRLRPALRVHDELVYVVDEDRAEELLATLQGVLRTPPTWWPQLIVWSEGDIADTYGAAK